MWSLAAVSFSTLQEAQAYAAHSPEYISPDNQDWLHPDYSSFYKGNRPGFLRRLFSWFGFSYSAWDARKFRKLLKSLVTSRERDGWKGSFAEQYKPHKGDTCIIWGDLCGAFHSLVRDLTYLHEQGIIDDHFKIIKPNYIFVFNGNVIDGSPYNLETLTLVLRLLEHNHSRLFYIRGHQEENEHWHNLGLAQELKIRAPHVSREAIPLNDLLVRFFNTLPSALYLTHDTDKEIEAVLITNTEHAITTFGGSHASYVLGEGDEQRGFFKAAHKKSSKKPVTIKAYITSEDRSASYHKTEGLTLLSTTGGIAHWLLFSSPTEQNQQLYTFQYDAFTQVSITDGIDNWTIGLMNQRLRSFDSFHESTLYHLASGKPFQEKNSAQERESHESAVYASKKTKQKTKQEVAVERKGEEIPPGPFRLATLTDFTKGTKQLGRAVQAGIELRFAQARSEGQSVPEIVFIDDRYTPAITRPEVERLLNMGINTFLMPTGTPTLESYLDFIKEGKVLVLFPLTGAPLFRQPELTYLIHLRASYADEGKALARYALNTMHAKKIFIFYQNDAFGKGLLKAAKKALGKEITYKAISYDRDETTFVEQVRQLEAYAPDTIMFFSTATATKGLIRQGGVEKVRTKKMVGCSDLAEADFVRLMKKYQLKVIYACVVPNPATSNLPMVQQFRKEAEKKGMALDPMSLESYIASDLLFSILNRITGRPTNQQIITQLEAIKDLDYKGIMLDFNPDTRTLIHSIWLDTGDPEWLQITVG